MRISQREARRLRQRVDQLERREALQRRVWAQEFPGGVEIGRATWLDQETIPTAVRTARKLHHAVVVVGDDSGLIRFMALPFAAL